jgi:hypothetical protein
MTHQWLGALGAAASEDDTHSKTSGHVLMSKAKDAKEAKRERDRNR